MARVPIKRPVVPEDTCPYIDMAQDLVISMSTQENAEWRAEQAKLVDALLEYIRDSNHRLRMSSKFWFDRSKKTDPG